jgi:hypothetical protein
VKGSASELEEAAIDAADAGQAGRIRLEARAAREIEDASQVAIALEVVTAAAQQTQPRSLRAFADRLARAYGLAVGRLRREEQKAVRATLRRAKDEGLGLGTENTLQ